MKNKTVAFIFAILNLICCLTVFYLANDKIGYTISIFSALVFFMNYIDYSKAD